MEKKNKKIRICSHLGAPISTPKSYSQFHRDKPVNICKKLFELKKIISNVTYKEWLQLLSRSNHNTVTYMRHNKNAALVLCSCFAKKISRLLKAALTKNKMSPMRNNH